MAPNAVACSVRAACRSRSLEARCCRLRILAPRACARRKEGELPPLDVNPELHVEVRLQRCLGSAWTPARDYRHHNILTTRRVVAERPLEFPDVEAIRGEDLEVHSEHSKCRGTSGHRDCGLGDLHRRITQGYGADNPGGAVPAVALLASASCTSTGGPAPFGACCHPRCPPPGCSSCRSSLPKSSKESSSAAASFCSPCALAWAFAGANMAPCRIVDRLCEHIGRRCFFRLYFDFRHLVALLHLAAFDQSALVWTCQTCFLLLARLAWRRRRRRHRDLLAAYSSASAEQNAMLF